MKQFTIARPVSFSGIGLHTGEQAKITLLPAEENTGIVFERIDLPERTRIPATVDCVDSVQRGTTISKDRVKIHTVEHLLAALADGNEIWPGIFGFEDTVLPQLERALIAGHDFVLLGERGQGKFEEVSWDEALDYTASKLKQIIKKHKPDSVGGLSSARCTNEDNYLFQKLIRAAVGTNNVDHCARL